MRHVTPAIALFAVLLASHSAWALRADELTFGSPQDRFVLKRSGGQYLLNGRAVELGTFQKFLGYFDVEPDGLCQKLPSRPDLRVIAKTGAKTIKREFYFAQKVMSDGEYCLDVGGQGIFFLPIHRHWFNKNTTVNTALGDRIVFYQNGREILNFKKVDEEWRNTNPQFFTNWEFFENVIGAIKSFKVHSRIHPAIIKDQPKYARHEFRVRTDNKEISFHRVGEKLWAAELPKTPWLVSSNSWSFFESMDLAQWKDPNFAVLQTIMDKSLPAKERAQAVDRLNNQWTKSIKHTLQNIVLDPEESSEVKLDAISRLRKHPSEDNMKVLARALDKTSDARVLYEVSNTLRIRNPGQKAIPEEADESERQKLIREWQKWAEAL